MSSRIPLLVALLIPSSALADLGGSGWNVEPTRFRLPRLSAEGTERGYVRSPTLSILATGHHPLGITDPEELDEVSAGAALRLELDVPIFTFLTGGAYVEGGWRRIWSDWEWDNVDFAVVDFGAHLRLRFTVGAMQFFAGAHAGMTRTRGHAEIQTYHYGAHGGMRAGKRVGAVLLLGITRRDWSGYANTAFDDSFETPFAELWGSLGLSIVLGDYR